MAAPDLSRRFLILLGDGGDPETFAFPCGANARSVTFTNNLGEETVLDCDDPLGELAAIQRWIESQDTSLTISGRVAKGSIEVWREWVDGGTEKNIRIQFDEAAADGGGYYTVAAYLQQLEWGSEGKGTATFTATIMGSGPRVWTAAA
ncbi:phage tail tube protein [Pseudooceanicola sp.]|uniref:phage tail tube protein n=1 Tax=Pseudooceanicola sp. TaxID=1914328 RepID=UPI0035177604